jgi:xylulokinase
VRRLLADVLGRPVRYVRLRSASAVGAAALAAHGVGARLPVHGEVTEVAPEDGPHRDALEQAYARWCEELAGQGQDRG